MENSVANIEIKHPEVWSLTLRLTPREIAYSVYSRMEENSLIFGSIPLNSGIDSLLKDIESAIYDNSFFLYDYESVHLIVESNHFLLIPDEFSNKDADECEKYYRFLFQNDNLSVNIDRIRKQKLSIAYGIRPDVEAFLRRTFSGRPLHHLLSPMIRFISDKEQNVSAKMFAYLNNDTVEIIAVKKGKLVFANYFRFSNPNDAFYYIVNSWQTADMNPATDSLHLLGDKDLRRSLLPLLRTYIPNVLQFIFPAQLLRLGRNALQAPLDLIITSICE